MTNTANDPYEPNNDFATATLITQTGTIYSVTDEEDADDIFKFESAAATSVRVILDWNDPTVLMSVVGYSAAGAVHSTACHTVAKPKNCVMPLPAGTYFIRIWRYPAAAAPFTGIGTYPMVTSSVRFEFR